MSDVYAVFNDLALHPHFQEQPSNSYQAKHWMEAFSKCLYEAEQKWGLGLRTYRHIYEISLAEDYTLLDWVNDSTVPEELRLRIRVIFESLSSLEEFPENQQGDPLFEAQYDGLPAQALGAAYLLESLAISLPTGNPHWEKSYLPLTVFQMDEESSEIEVEETEVHHFSQIVHLQAHEMWLQQRLLRGVSNGKELLRQARKWYPHLIFCENAERQIKQLRAGAFVLRRIINRLFELERYCQSWDTGSFDGSKIPNSSGESNPTMEQFGKERQFRCPDGETRIFEYHLKALPNAWRIHIYPDNDQIFPLADDGRKKILIGYVGKHLPTANDPT